MRRGADFKLRTSAAHKEVTDLCLRSRKQLTAALCLPHSFYMTTHYSDYATVWTSDVRIPAGKSKGFLPLRHRCIQIGSEAHPASYPIPIVGCYTEGKAAGT